MQSDDIRRICHEVCCFAAKADWTIKGLPVVTWEFATIADFASAEADLMMALDPITLYGRGGLRRAIGDGIVELTCNGVVFRLCCKQLIMTRHGPYGAADAKVEFRDAPRRA